MHRLFTHIALDRSLCYWTNVSIPSLFSDADCNGGTCNFDNDCTCDCPVAQCLTQASAGCDFVCDCGIACDFTHPSFSPTASKALDNCLSECATCDPDSSNSCEADQDCIKDISNDSSQGGYCVESAICTSDKEDLCDKAWKVRLSRPTMLALSIFVFLWISHHLSTYIRTCLCSTHFF